MAIRKESERDIPMWQIVGIWEQYSVTLNYGKANCPSEQQTRDPDLESTALDLNGNIYNYIKVSVLVYVCVCVLIGQSNKVLLFVFLF